jgi:hypothetical protein
MIYHLHSGLCTRVNQDVIHRAQGAYTNATLSPTLIFRLRSFKIVTSWRVGYSNPTCSNRMGPRRPGDTCTPPRYGISGCLSRSSKMRVPAPTPRIMEVWTQHVIHNRKRNRCKPTKKDLTQTFNDAKEVCGKLTLAFADHFRHKLCREADSSIRQLILRQWTPASRLS